MVQISLYAGWRDAEKREQEQEQERETEVYWVGKCLMNNDCLSIDSTIFIFLHDMDRGVGGERHLVDRAISAWSCVPLHA